MAAVDISGFNGLVTLTGHGGDAKGFTLTRTMTDKDVSRYGGTRFAKFRGGTLTLTGDINVFLRKGAAGSAPAITTPAVDGSALVLAFETLCTLTGVAILSMFNSNHTFGDPAVEATYGYKFNGDVTEAWVIA